MRMFREGLDVASCNAVVRCWVAGAHAVHRPCRAVLHVGGS